MVPAGEPAEDAAGLDEQDEGVEQAKRADRFDQVDITDQDGQHGQSDQASPSEQAGQPEKAVAGKREAALSTASTGHIERVAIADDNTKTADDKQSSDLDGAQDAGAVEGADVAAERGEIAFLESYEADVTYTALNGGTLVPGASAKEGRGQVAGAITEHFEDSLAGVSKGVTAVPYIGYQFAHWRDSASLQVVSTSASFALERPFEGWPEASSVEALFLPSMYEIVLDANGGASYNADSPATSLTLQVAVGGVLQLPANGSNVLWYKRDGCVFMGWSTSPDGADASSASTLSFPDAQVFNSAVETLLADSGALAFDWSSGTLPQITLYAQWLTGQVSVSYAAGEGGHVASGAMLADEVDSIYRETFAVDTGERADGESFEGPAGAIAVARARHHFTGWSVEGAAAELSDEAASSPVLQAATVWELARPEGTHAASTDFNDLAFTAAFAPNTYVFAYDANGGMGALAAQTLAYGDMATTASTGVELEGYALAGWNTAEDGGGMSFGLGEELGRSSIDRLIRAGELSDEDGAGVMLYAQWESLAEPEPDPDPDPDPEPEPGPDPDPEPEPAPEPLPSPEPNERDEPVPDVWPQPAPDNPPAPEAAEQDRADKTVGTGDDENADDAGRVSEGTRERKRHASKTDTNGGGSGDTPQDDDAEEPATRRTPVTRPVSAPFAYTQVASDDEAAQPEPVAKPVSAPKQAVVRQKSGALAAGGGARLGGPVVILNPSDVLNAGGSADGDFFSQLMTPSGMQAASTAVAAVAAVGAVAGLVGIGVSVASAATIGAATMGAAGAVGLSTAADLAADLAASAAAGAAAGAVGRRRREEESPYGGSPEQ